LWFCFVTTWKFRPDAEAPPGPTSTILAAQWIITVICVAEEQTSQGTNEPNFATVANYVDHEISPTSLIRHHHLGGTCLPVGERRLWGASKGGLVHEDRIWLFFCPA
jgi:hypothetical protein